MFGRATITLGIGPHSSLCLFCVVHFCSLVNVCFCCVRFSFSIASHAIRERLQNDLFCVERDEKT